jgi:hypothetical protein
MGDKEECLNIPLEFKTHAVGPYVTKFFAVLGLRKASLNSAYLYLHDNMAKIILLEYLEFYVSC